MSAFMNTSAAAAEKAKRDAREELLRTGDDHDPMEEFRRPTTADRESEYQARRRKQLLSPDRADPFADGGKTPDLSTRTFQQIMREQAVTKEKADLMRDLQQQCDMNTENVVEAPKKSEQIPGMIEENEIAESKTRKRGRWDIVSAPMGSVRSDAAIENDSGFGSAAEISVKKSISQPHEETPLHYTSTPRHQIIATNLSTSVGVASAETRVWAETPVHKSAVAASAGAQLTSTPSVGARWDATPAQPSSSGMVITAASSVRRNRWDETPKNACSDAAPHVSSSNQATPVHPSAGVVTDVSASVKRKSRWDETPVMRPTRAVSATLTVVRAAADEAAPLSSEATPVGVRATPMMTPGSGATPVGMKAMGMMTPAPHLAMASMTPEQFQAFRYEKELDERNKPLTDAELDQLFPPGYKIVSPPATYVPLRTPQRKLMATPTPGSGQVGFFMQAKSELNATKQTVLNVQPADATLPMFQQEDTQYFEKLLQDVDENQLAPEEAKERKIMKLLLKIKNGTPPQRKQAMRFITDKARELGAGPLFNQILPVLMSPTLEDQERHMLVKVIDRVLYKLDDLVRPYVHKILVVIEPLLIDEDNYARVEGREIISNLAKAAGLATMIFVMHPDIDNPDECVRNTTARAFAVVASALGIPALLPFLCAVCKSKKSWQARHTGVKITQQIAILMGCAVLPHLRSLVEIIEDGLIDVHQEKVCTITALSIAALAEASAPYGIESFGTVIETLYIGIGTYRGKCLGAFLKAMGNLLPLMDADFAKLCACEAMVVCIREFASPDKQMKKIVLQFVEQAVLSDGVEAQYLIDEILPPFFEHVWNHKIALDRRNYKQLVKTTVEIAQKVGCCAIVKGIVDGLKDENELYRKMVVQTIEKVLETLGAGDIDERLEEQLVDGILYAFREQTTEDTVLLNGFGVVVTQLGQRIKPYLPQICDTILWRFNNKSAKVRQQSADLIAKIANVMKLCDEEKLMGRMGLVLYEFLGEEYPEVLGSILGALTAIVNVVGLTQMTPPIIELLPRLTPILKNRHEKVQENCIDLVGRIADRGAEHVSAREWMRICFELLELLKAHKKAIRRAAVNTCGYIAKAIGSHDVLATLLNNLKVQERQNRVCTTVAIAIVAETCSPFTVLPALMNEYRVPELNVQNGVLKALAFMFEYIGEMAKDYAYAVTPLLEDALQNRDLVHRQTACTCVGHMALGVVGFGCEDALVHLLNFVWPNLLETSPHMAQAFMFAIEAMRVAIGLLKLLMYVVQGLFHPARRVREAYWRVYNVMYMGSQDVMVVGYPRIVLLEEEEEEQAPKKLEASLYVCYELEYVL